MLQSTCGALTVASLVALGQPPTAIAAHDGTAPLARSYAAIPTEWDPGGPLAIPTIGVVPPGLEDWYDPNAPRPFPADTATRPTLTVSTPATRSPVRSPAPAPVPPTATGGPADAASTETPQRTVSPADAAPAGTTVQETTAQETTPQVTTAPSTTTPSTGQSTTAATTSTPPATTSPTTTSPATTETPPPTDEPDPTPAPAETNERGNAVLSLGEQLTVLDADTGALVLAVGIDSVSTEVTCTGPDGAPAADGHLIAVQVRATTGSDLAAVGGAPEVRSGDFFFLGPDGATLTATGTPSAESCVPDAEAFPAGPLGPEQEFAGVVVLDVPEIAGTLVFAPDFLPVGGEWTY